MDSKSQHAWRFGPFHFDPGTGYLHGPETSCTLLPKDCLVLEQLLQAEGKLVSKETLHAQCWPQQAVVGGDVLKASIRRLRQALGDDYQAPRYIETLNRRGYRFLPAARRGPLAEPSAASATTSLNFPQAAPEFVGRNEELALLHELLSTAQSGAFHLLVISGEAGIGKTALLNTFLNGRPEHQETILLQGQCLNCHGPAEAYQPLLAGMEQLAEKLGPELLVELLRRLAPMWLLQLPWLIDAAERRQLQNELQGVSGQRMQRELLALGAELSRQYTQLVVIEDMHWCDHATVELLQRLAGLQPPPRRLLLLVTTRGGENPGHPFQAVCDQLRGSSMCRYLRLSPLPEAAMTSYLAATFPGRQIPAGLPGWLHDFSGGNPLLFKAMIDQGLRRQWLRDDGDALCWQQPTSGNAAQIAPRHLRYLVDSRLGQLSAAERECLETASVCGMSFPVRLLAEVADQDQSSEARCEQLSRTTSYLRRAATLTLGSGEKNPCFAFRHALYQQVLHDAIPSLRRQQLHQSVARRLIAAFPEPSVEISLQLALHYEQAGDGLAAAAHRQRVAIASLQRHAYQEAIDHARRGLAALGELPDSPERESRELALLLPLGASSLATMGYAAPAVEAIYSRAQQLQSRAPSADCQLTVLCSLAIYRLAKAELAEMCEAATVMQEYAEQTDNPVDVVGAKALATLHAFYRGDQQAALQAQQQCQERYDPAGQSESFLELGYELGITALAHAAMASWLLGQPEQAMAKIAQALAIAREYANPFMQIWCLCYQGWLHVYQEELAPARHCAEEARDLSQAHGIEYYRAQSSIILGWLESVSGQPEHGIAAIEENIAAHRQTGAELIRGFFLYILADALHRAGLPDEALSRLAEAIALSEETGEVWWLAEMHRLHGVVLLALADADIGSAGPERQLAAETSLTAALNTASAQQAKMLELRAATSLAALRLHQGRAAEGRALLNEVYSRFSEGFTTHDLRQAQKVSAQFAEQ